MKKATAVSPANIAFIKYWGKKNPGINIPYNNSVSMNLSNCLTTATVEFSSRLRSDTVFINGKCMKGNKKEKVLKILNIVRNKSGVELPAKVFSVNNFPSDAGIASSASCFSALALASSSASGLKLNKKELSILARLGSGSACRSIPDGFSEWFRGQDTDSSYATQVASASHWDLRDIVVIVNKGIKQRSSTDGHAVATTSPFFEVRQKNLRKRLKELKRAINDKDFNSFGKLVEEEAIEMHLIAMTSKPPIFYWNRGTTEVISKVREWREGGPTAFFTIDAGCNVHVICRAIDEKEANSKLKRMSEVLCTITNKPGRGAHIINRHLF